MFSYGGGDDGVTAGIHVIGVDSDRCDGDIIGDYVGDCGIGGGSDNEDSRLFRKRSKQGHFYVVYFYLARIMEEINIKLQFNIHNLEIP